MRPALALLLFLVAVPGCSDHAEVVPPDMTSVSLTAAVLPPLGDDNVYSLWAAFYEFNRRGEGDSPQHEGEYVHVGDFVIRTPGAPPTDPSGSAVRLRLPPSENPQLLGHFALTIERTGEPGGENGSVLLAGSVTGTAREGRARLTLADPDAFGTDFAQTSGVYTLVSPTSPPDSNAGVWFIAGVSTGQPGLRGLPRAPAGWVYNGWVMMPNLGFPPIFLSTGAFVRPDSADEDGAGPGVPGSPSFAAPGQDFSGWRPPLPDLTAPGVVIMVTLELSTRPRPLPSPFVLLSSADLPAFPPAQRTRPLGNVISRRAPSLLVTVLR